MTIQEAIAQTTQQLDQAGIGTPRLDTLVLLEDITGLSKARLLTHPEQLLDQNQIDKLKKQVQQRSQQLPLSYVRGKTEFFGYNFLVDQRVLEPRPESETMIEELNKLVVHNKINHVIEIGTGSGALIIAAKLSNPSIQVYATDISTDCLRVARLNLQAYKLNIPLLQGDLLHALPARAWQQHTAIIANLPYVPDNWQINPPAQHEPPTAIFGGDDGLDIYRRLFTQLQDIATAPEFILTESMPPQHIRLSNIAKQHSYSLSATNDFIQVFSRSALHPA